MKDLDWLQFVFLILVLTVITKPLGIYVFKVLTPKEKLPLDFLLKPLEKITYRLCGIGTDKEQNWKEYLFSLLSFSMISLLATFLLLACQSFFPLNPEKLRALSADLNFNTSVSFVTNTDWQSYGGEFTLSYFSQMVPLTLQNFLSPAIGLAVAAALVRAITRHSSTTVGNFWVDLVRISYHLLFPLALALALFFVSEGTPQNFKPYTRAITLENAKQTIVQGPIASQKAITILGTNGAGYTNVGSAHPYENPTPLSNFFQILFILAIPAAQTYYLGRAVKNQNHGWALYITMALIFFVVALFCAHFEMKGNPQFTHLTVEKGAGNLEGKEQRFGILGSTLFATATTTATNGSVNSSHDAYTPLGGFIPLLNLQFGQAVWGGAGSGLYNMILVVILSVFTAGLIIGRIPEYLGNRIEPFDIKVAIFAHLPYLLAILGLTAWACISSWGLAALGNQGPHGFSEILYAYSSAAVNNGSSFAGLYANTPWWNLTLAFAMLVGRFLVIVPVLALAGSLTKKKNLPLGASSFPVSGATFIALLISVILLIGALAFLPALVVGPFLEQFFMNAGKLF